MNVLIKKITKMRAILMINELEKTHTVVHL